MKYVINEVHQFEMTVTGKSIPVSIDVDTTTLKFTFDQTSLDFQKTQAITISNPGNSDAFFKFSLGKQKNFVPEVLEATVKPKQKMFVPIKFVAPIITGN